ncbi:hypothetical protein FQZ97_777970 [compost metagenome]
MQLGEASRWHAPQAAVRPDFVVVRAPDGHGCSGLMQGLEPALVEVFIAELAIEALDVAVLHRAPGLDQDVADAVHLRPSATNALRYRHDDQLSLGHAPFGRRQRPQTGRSMAPG